MGSRVYIGNLPTSIVERDLEEEFSRFGTLRSVWVARKPPGFAFIEFDDPRDADDAVRKMDGFQGWRVEHSRRGERGGGGGGYRGRSPPRYRGGGGGYRDRSPPPRSRRRSPSYEPVRRRSPSYEPVRRRSPSYSPKPRRSPSYDRSPPRRSRSRS